MRTSMLAVAAITATILVGGPAQSETGTSETARSDTLIEVVPRSAVAFQPLNPARGDASPQAGVLWGDLRRDEPTGSIVTFVPGFASPPHIHNVSYRAVVIGGAVHNDDPQAEIMWMAPGSFWTQPAGEVHITAADAESGPATILLEIDEGPYLVQPFSDAFFNGQSPVNVSAGNIVWLDASDVVWVDLPGAATARTAPQIAFLWGDPREGGRNGTFMRLPSGFQGTIASGDGLLRAVIIAGTAEHHMAGSTAATSLDPGSYFGSHGPAIHEVGCAGATPCILYLSAEGRYQLAPS